MHVYTLIVREHSNIREQDLQLYQWHHVKKEIFKKERETKTMTSESCQSERNVEEKGVVLVNITYVRTKAVTWRRGYCSFFIQRTNLRSSNDGSEAEYLWISLVVQRAFRITMKARERMKRQMKVSFDRKCKILCRASHFVGGRFTYICTYVDREYFEMIVAHCNPHAKKIFFCYKYSNAN